MSSSFAAERKSLLLREPTPDEVKAAVKLTKKVEDPMVPISDMFLFASRGVKIRFAFGMIFSGLAGLVFPGLAFATSNSFSTVTAAPGSTSDFLGQVAEAAFIFMGVGAYGFVTYAISAFLMETSSAEMSANLSRAWFAALLRQDMAFHDLTHAAGAASLIASNTSTYARGVGRKLGQGALFTVALLGGLIFAFYSSWQASLVVLCVLPVLVANAFVFIKMNKEQSSFKEANYAVAGNIVYTTVLNVRTVLALNAADKMVQQFNDATEQAYVAARDRGFALGLVNGMFMGGFQLSYLVLTLYGSYLIYDQIKQGCDPTGTSDTLPACKPSGADIFGAFIGMSLAGVGVPTIAGAAEVFTKARVAIYPAMLAINRKVGVLPVLLKEVEDEEEGLRSLSTLPPYAIDSSSTTGLKPSIIKGDIEFKSVGFSYPARRKRKILNGFNLKIQAGQTVALVGPSGGGKSTIVSLLERFYDVDEGQVTIDGIDIRELNVKYLRERVGLVQQEPVLFATSIAENIRYGRLDGTLEDIVQAAKMANAHSFISSFPDRYDTVVGRAQLSGGQKQRTAIARTLMRKPAILLLDEATSALDSESELVVQRALDDLLATSSRTTIIIAHRLSTIRNADMIVFVQDGQVMENGTHDELMAKPDGLYKKLTEAGHGPQEIKAVADVNKEDLSLELKGEPNESNVSRHTRRTSHLVPVLRLRDVNFVYPNRPSNIVFSGLNLTIRQGETMALVGPSGQGKSTIVGLVERFYDPSGGTVEILGNNIRDINVRSLREMIGLVDQEPALFAMSIAENIAYGRPGASMEDIIAASVAANAHNFIMAFPDGYKTEVGQQGSQLSGGQKQRIAIARAVIKKPAILLLDEATSALDGESQNVVQEALDNLASKSDQTTLVIAHRLSTIRKADRIAYIANGKVQEIGTFEELMVVPDGRFKRLQDLQHLRASEYLLALKEKAHDFDKIEEDDEEDDENEENFAEPETDDPVLPPSVSVWRFVSRDDIYFLAIGTVGAVISGLIFPAWGVMFAQMIQVLYKNVLPCDDKNPVDRFASCRDYFDSVANEARQQSFKLAYGWLGIIATTLIGSAILYYGFGAASEKMSKRIRNASFEALVRQEVAYFDCRNVGDLVTQLTDDASLLQAFTGEPIRLVVMNLASMLVALVLAFVFMWPFALLFLAVMPFMVIASSLEASVAFSDNEEVEDENGPGAIALESMTYIKTVASLTLEQDRWNKYTSAVNNKNNSSWSKSALVAFCAGLGQIASNWGCALIFWWGGYLLINYPTKFTSNDFLISLSGLLLGINGMAIAAAGLTDRKEAEAAAKRISTLVDRQSSIDPLSKNGKKELTNFNDLSESIVLNWKTHRMSI